MILARERKLIVQYGKKLIEAGLTKGTGGNISIYNREKRLMAISPSGIDYFETRPEDVVIMDLQGNIIDGKKKPSSEYSMHKIFYEKKDDIKAVVHTHSTYATAIACLNWEIPAVHYLVGFSGNKVPIAEYATFGTEELANNAYQAIQNYRAVLLANHGLLAVGNNIATAFATAEEIEFTAKLYYLTKSIGNPKILSDDEMNIIAKKFKTYGQK